LSVGCIYSENVFKQTTVERLIESYKQRLEKIIEHCISAEAGGYTASDFPLARLKQEQVDRLFCKEAGIEDVDVLSPMQEGMLFHKIYSPESGEYFEQVSFPINEPLELEALEQAWQMMVDNNAILRTGFAWEGLERPIQIVYKQVRMPINVMDWRGQTEAEQRERLGEYLKRDRAAGFDLSRAPLMRVTVIRKGAEQYQIIWSHHHILLDGWSIPLVMKEVFSLYEAKRLGEEYQREQRR